MLNSTSSFICEAHSSPAQVFCMCMGTKLYLCEFCLQKHMKIDRQHIIVQVSSDVIGLEDVEKLNRKSQVKESLRNTLEELTQRIEIERKAVLQYLSQYEAYHISQIQQAYATLLSHSNALYDLYARTCCQMNEELDGNRGTLSAQTGLFVDFAAHISASTVPYFLQIDEFLGKSVQLKIEPLPEIPSDPFSSLLKTWGQITKCECELCEDYRSLFGLPLQTSWECYNCRTENKGCNECSYCHCGREWVDYLTCKDLKLTEDRKKWICPKCSSKNGLHEGVCCKCKTSCSAIQQGLSTLPTFMRTLLYPS